MIAFPQNYPKITEIPETMIAQKIAKSAKYFLAFSQKVSTKLGRTAFNSGIFNFYMSKTAYNSGIFSAKQRLISFLFF